MKTKTLLICLLACLGATANAAPKTGFFEPLAAASTEENPVERLTIFGVKPSDKPDALLASKVLGKMAQFRVEFTPTGTAAEAAKGQEPVDASHTSFLALLATDEAHKAEHVETTWKFEDNPPRVLGIPVRSVCIGWAWFPKQNTWMIQKITLTWEGAPDAEEEAITKAVALANWQLWQNKYPLPDPAVWMDRTDREGARIARRVSISPQGFLTFEWPQIEIDSLKEIGAN